MLTLRKKIAEALKQDSLDLREISKRFGIREKDTLDHLHHIAKSAHSMGFNMKPPQCNQCGYSFKKRTRLNTRATALFVKVNPSPRPDSRS